MSSGSDDPQGPFDLVYTWVDDTLPGFAAQHAQYAQTSHDRNPNRTRDNLDVLKYSLRSIEAYAPWVRKVYLLTCRPQVPPWLDLSHPQLQLVHHDEIMPAAMLPTFNSFAIISYLHMLPGVSRRFVYLNDDMLLGRPVRPGDLATPDGLPRAFRRPGKPPGEAVRHDTSTSPWNRAKSEVIHRLGERFAPVRREYVQHVPQWIDRDWWAEALDLWPEATALTRASRFRDSGNIAPEYLYLHYLPLVGRAHVEPLWRTFADTFYMPLENNPWETRAMIALARLRHPKFITLNDNFDANPNPKIVAAVRRYLEESWPVPSRFERTASA